MVITVIFTYFDVFFALFKLLWLVRSVDEYLRFIHINDIGKHEF